VVLAIQLTKQGRQWKYGAIRAYSDVFVTGRISTNSMGKIKNHVDWDIIVHPSKCAKKKEL
jgi:hypothetical protein